jgi:hypothetical protein
VCGIKESAVIKCTTSAFQWKLSRMWKHQPTNNCYWSIKFLQLPSKLPPSWLER